MPLKDQTESAVRPIILFSFAVIILAWGMHLRMGAELLDDGAFFLRYAVNAANGYFWVWNPGEPPVWGASAPLYPMLVALPIKLGLQPVTAIIATGMIVSSVSLAALIFLTKRHFGILTAIALLIFLILDSNIMWASINGLESPMTMAILTAAVWSLIERPRAIVVGLISGLLMVHKLDLVPAGGLLLLAIWFRDRRFPLTAVLVAGLLAAVWYTFAWWYFGAPVPNSFLTKALHQNDLTKIIDWTWFGKQVLWTGIHKWMFALLLIWVVLCGRKYWPIAVFTFGSIAVHLTAYTIKYPFEPYAWYTIPATLLLLLGASISIGTIFHALKNRLPAGAWTSSFAVAGLTFTIAATSLSEERTQTEAMTYFTDYFEADRSEAGRWVAENVPAEFRVFTSWGNPAYFSDRYVFDGSFLNRQYEPGDLVSTYRPEILILQAPPGSKPSAPADLIKAGGYPIQNSPYKVVRVFDKTFESGSDYFFVVLAREDVMSRLPPAEIPRDISSYISQVELGDKFGAFDNRDSLIFIHPGENIPTSFSLNSDGFSKVGSTCQISVNARISDRVPIDAIKRGGAVVRIRILKEGTELLSTVVDANTPLNQVFTCEDRGEFHFEVGPEGSPDSDWLWMTIK